MGQNLIPAYKCPNIIKARL